MEINKWFGGCLVRAFPWIDHKRIYFNVRYYLAGQSVHAKPAWDKTVYVNDNEAGRKLVYENTDSLVDYVAAMQIVDGSEVTITAE